MKEVVRKGEGGKEGKEGNEGRREGGKGKECSLSACHWLVLDLHVVSTNVHDARHDDACAGVDTPHGRGQRERK